MKKKRFTKSCKAHGLEISSIGTKTSAWAYSKCPGKSCSHWKRCKVYENMASMFEQVIKI